MSVYAVNKVCWLVERNPEFRERFRSQPEATLADFSLTPDERTAILAGDVITLFRNGGHPFLLQNLGRYEVCGLDTKTYRQLITSLADEVS
jgi:hypothetical protein